MSSACFESLSRICRPSRTLSSAERHGISRSFWNTMPILPRKKSNSRNGAWPITRASPELGSIRPATMLNIVDLPQPVLPSTATISPLAISNDNLSTATKSPRPSGRRNVLLTFVKRITGSGIGSHRPLGHRAIAQRPILDRGDGLLHDQDEQHQLQR